MVDPLTYAFLDESGTVGVSTGSHYLVVAGLSTNTRRDIRISARRVLKKLWANLTSSEFKAANFKDTGVMHFLQVVSQIDISIVAVIIDQKTIKNPSSDAEDIYRWAATRAVYHLVERYPRLQISLDKRYTKESLRFSLEKSIRMGIENLLQKMVLIRQEDSLLCKELQAADAIAWAFFQKYEHGDPRFFNAIAHKVIVEELIAHKDWKGR